MKARIYQPTKTAMQSGRANTAHWILEFEAEKAKFVEPLMGWTGSRETSRQVRLRFKTKEEAIAYAQKHRFEYEVALPKERRITPKTYSANFAYNRVKT